MKKNKWGKQYWVDLGERVTASAIGGVLTMITADAAGVVSGSPKQWWVVVGIPTAVSVCKGLLVNLGGNDPTASVVNVTSDSTKPN